MDGEDLYDEFCNYIGPDIKEDDDEIDESEEKDSPQRMTTMKDNID